MSIDSAACERAGEHQVTARHPRSVCPVERHPLPAFTKDITGKYFGGAFWRDADYRVTIATQDGGPSSYLLVVEDSGGTEVGHQILSPAHADGILRMASTDHSLSGYQDDWDIPTGMERVLTWTMLTQPNHQVMLTEGGIDEVAAWLRYATGEDEWTGGSDWEY